MRSRKGSAASVAFVLVATGALLVTGTASAQEPLPSTPAEKKAEKQRRLAKLVARYKSMNPQQRAELLKTYREKFKDKTPAERQRMRRALKRLRQGQGNRKLAAKRKRFNTIPKAKRKRWKKMLRRLIRNMPPEQRNELAQLDVEERRRRIKLLIKRHRRTMVDQHISKLPPAEREMVERRLEGLEGKERFREARRAIKGFVMTRARQILDNPRLTPEQKQQRLKQLVKRYVPKKKWREQMRRKLNEHRLRRGHQRRDLDRRRREKRQNDRPGKRRPAKQRPARDRPLRPRQKPRKRRR